MLLSKPLKYQKFAIPALVATLFAVSSCGPDEDLTENNVSDGTESAAPDTVVKKANIRFGFNFDEFEVVEGEVEPAWTLSHMFLPHGINQVLINQAAQLAKDSAKLNYVVDGRKFFMLSDPKDTSHRAQICIYERDMVHYTIFDFRDSLRVYPFVKSIDTTERSLGGVIEKGSNLTFAIQSQLGDAGQTGELAESIAGIFAWSIDFFRIHPDDKFRVIYDEYTVDGEPYGIGNIKAIWFEHMDDPNYAFFYELDSTRSGYYSDSAKEMKRPFLMAPVKYSRISSGYSGRRFHPVQKRWKSHLGTDYAAPHGTPIMATADGTVTKASRTSGNGIYVKLRHNATYETQYLHMSRHAEGIRPGVRVKQGQCIGYVGSTGLATGPHVCYRFWKNGKQVNHRALKFPSAVPMPEKYKAGYLEYIKPVKKQLDGIELNADKLVARSE